MEQDNTLPRDGQGILALAARSMFQLFSSVSQGMFLVDRSGRIVWVNDGYGRGRDPQHPDAPRAGDRAGRS
jgi:PAS domain-containing protein